MMDVEEDYCVVLQYRWINQFPPPEPEFDIVKKIYVNPEEMLCLATLIVRIGDTIDIIDNKVPWYMNLVRNASKNTEVDGEIFLPYVVTIKGEGDGEFPESPDDSLGTVDLGWAIDLHHHIGNNLNYNTRLHTNKVDDGVLFINNKRIITEQDITNPNNPIDPIDPGDTYTEINNNIIISDSNMDPNPGSNSGKICYSLKSTILNNGDAETSGASLCFNGETKEATISNRTNFDEPLTTINYLTLTSIQDKVTINGYEIWHAGNLDIVGGLLAFLGFYENHPLLRPDGSNIQIGDIYYNNIADEYFYYKVDS
jgi:hypothetical protein